VYQCRQALWSFNARRIGCNILDPTPAIPLETRKSSTKGGMMSVMTWPSSDDMDASKVVCCVAYRNGETFCELALDEIPSYLHQPGMLVWLGLHEPDEGLMRRIQSLFGLHDLAVEDAYRAHQRPKLEVYGEGLFVVLHTAQLNGNQLAFGETHVFVGPS
jgi:hypothetical protein